MIKKPSSKKIRIAINGLGRVGRVFLRIAHNNPRFEIAALSSRSDLALYAHLLKYDSTYGVWDKEVRATKNKLIIEDKAYDFYQDTGEGMPWKKAKIDLVVDASGKYTKKEKAVKHIEAGAKFMIATAPMENADETFVLGVNHNKFNPQAHKIISAGSCTTVCSSLTIKVLEESFGLKQAFINTVHGFTNDQNLLDSSHKDFRRARSALASIIPTSSGVSKTIVKLYPHLKGKISALALRVPVPAPSVVVLTAELKKTTSKEVLIKTFERAANGALKGNLGVSKLPLVSCDYIGNPNGATIDLQSIDIVGGKMANILAWYDNEWGYVFQTVKLVEYLCGRIARS